jgi:hypothetical protein
MLKIRAYLYRFKIIETPNCPCGNDNQTAEHILLECEILKEDRERLIAAVAKADNWPINKEMLIKKQIGYMKLKIFCRCSLFPSSSD